MNARAARVFAGVVVAVLALNVVLVLLDKAAGQPGGPESSSLAAQPRGLAAYADLLGRYGHPVSQLRRRPSDATLDPRSTAVVLDPSDIDFREERALRSFVERGGRLVAGGTAPRPWLRGTVPRAPSWSAGGPRRAAPLASAPETAGVSDVRTAGDGHWRAPAAYRPVIGQRGSPVLLVGALGHGRVALLADTSPLQNRLLSQGDDAALGLALAGERGRAVTFVETVHGYGEQRGVAALPGRWKWALAGFALAGLLWLLYRGRRLGPPEDESRSLPPPRREYVSAIATALERSKDPAAAGAPVQEAARRRLERRARLGPDADPDAVLRAAARAGVPADEAQALVRPLHGDEDLIAAGRALARLSDGEK